MPTRIQANYTQGQDVVVNVTLTAHHRGHFVFSACPISPGEVATQDCFAQHRLTFVEDLLYGGNYDPNYPERAYIAPMNDPNYVPDYTSSNALIEYSFKMHLPQDVYGDLVLIQWLVCWVHLTSSVSLYPVLFFLHVHDFLHRYYLTANSCYHDGYLEYSWPESWGGNMGTSSDHCGDVSPDGGAVPEQFW